MYLNTYICKKNIKTLKMKKQLLVVAALILATFSTAQIHFQEGFEGGLPGTWATFRGTNGLGTTEDWQVSNPGLLSDSCMFVNYEGPLAGTSEDWLVTSLVTLGATNNRLRFSMAQDFTSDWGSLYKIKVSTTSQTSHASFTTIQTYTESDFPASTWITQTVDLSAYDGQSIYIAFVLEQNDGDIFALDSIVVETPTCSTPTGLTASSITTSGATLEWNGSDTSYQIAYFPYAGAPNAIFLTATDSSYALTGLNSNTYVTYFVREICGSGDTSLWSSAYSFSTLCTPGSTLPYVENFDLDTFSILPCGWVRENGNGDNQEFRILTDASANSGTKVLGIAYNAAAAMNDWVISPEFTLTGGATYEVKLSYKTSASFPEDFSISYGAGQTSTGQTNSIATFSTITTGSVWIDTVLSFTPASNGNFSIGIHGTSTANQDFLFFDNFELAMATTTEVEQINNLNVNIYPNPTNGQFTISNKENEAVNIIIKDVQGKIIRNINNLNGLATTTISIDNASKGMYLVTIESANATTTKRLIVK